MTIWVIGSTSRGRRLLRISRLLPMIEPEDWLRMLEKKVKMNRPPSSIVKKSCACLPLLRMSTST